MTNKTKISEAKREAFIEACKEAWNMIAFDILQLQDDNEMTAKDAQDCTADYVDIPGWWDLTYEERHEYLAVAIPNNVCL